jgi:hypothetical protein
LDWKPGGKRKFHTFPERTNPPKMGRRKILKKKREGEGAEMPERKQTDKKTTFPPI